MDWILPLESGTLNPYKKNLDSKMRQIKSPEVNNPVPSQVVYFTKSKNLKKKKSLLCSTLQNSITGLPKANLSKRPKNL